MSGGRFNSCGYIYYQVEQFADELENNIEKNEDFSMRQDTLDYLRGQVSSLRKISQIMRHIDYLYSGDHGEDSFHSIIKELECQ